MKLHLRRLAMMSGLAALSFAGCHTASIVTLPRISAVAPVACPPGGDVVLTSGQSVPEPYRLDGVLPIDLPTALQLADARNPDIALARERINEALARQTAAQILWLPNIEFSPTWTDHNGPIQRAAGDVVDVSRSAVSVMGGPTLSLPLGDALLAPLAARQVTAARHASALDVANDRLLDVAGAYIDLLQAFADMQINDESFRNARTLLSITESFEKVGKVSAADTARARVEVQRRERQRYQIQGRMGVASARLAQLTFMPQDVHLRPADPIVVPVALVSEAIPLADLLAQAMTTHPELAEGRASIEAAIQNWRRARVAPLLPSLRISYAAGGFSGGPNSTYSPMDERDDFSAAAVWQLQSLGLGNLAAVRERRSQVAQEQLRQAAVQARIINDVTSAFNQTYARRRELAAAQTEVSAAADSYRLNEERIRRAPEQARPIELLQAVQALAQARIDYLQAVADYNRAQFRLYAAVGCSPASAPGHGIVLPTTEATVPPAKPDAEVLPQPNPGR